MFLRRTAIGAALIAAPLAFAAPALAHPTVTFDCQHYVGYSGTTSWNQTSQMARGSPSLTQRTGFPATRTVHGRSA
jgi:hypothetical protein